MAEGYVMLARLRLAQGDVGTVLDTLQKADQIAGRAKIDPWIASWADECRLRLWPSTGNLSAAIQWAWESVTNLHGALVEVFMVQ